MAKVEMAMNLKSQGRSFQIVPLQVYWMKLVITNICDCKWLIYKQFTSRIGI